MPVSMLIKSVAAIAMAGAAAVAPVTAVRTVASYPHGAFLENLDRAPNGDLFYTSYADRTLYRWKAPGAPVAFVTLPAHPVGILAEADGFVVTAHVMSFMEGPGFAATNRILLLDRAGRVRQTIALRDARFLNGLVRISPRQILIADSFAGIIWTFDPKTLDVRQWLADPLLAQSPAVSSRPGVNGLKRRGEWLYISNSSRGAIYRVALAGAAPRGALETVAEPGPVDDFTFDRDDSIIATTHGQKLLRVRTGKPPVEILSEGCDSCTSVNIAPDGKLIVLTTGDLVEGGTKPARVLEISHPRG